MSLLYSSRGVINLKICGIGGHTIWAGRFLLLLSMCVLLTLPTPNAVGYSWLVSCKVLTRLLVYDV